MRPHPSIWILFVAVLFAACHRPAAETQRTTSLPSSELVAIDSLMWTQPDSALMRLLSCYDTVEDRHYANLLLAELLYKNDYEQTNRSELLKAVAYYDSSSCPFLVARAHYINGVGYYERDSVVLACEEYLKALEIMEERFTEKELVGNKAQFMALTYNRIGDLFSKQFMMQPSISCYEKSLYFCMIEPTSPTGVSKTLFRIGKQYEKMDKADKAREYYLLAAKKTTEKNGLLYRDILANMALCDYETGRARKQPLNVLRWTLAQAENENERLTRSFTLGSIFSEEGLLDSALYYLKPVFENTEKPIQKIQAAEYLHVIYDSLGDLDNSNNCMRFLTENKHSEGEDKSLVSMLESEFHTYLKQKQQKQIEREKKEVVQKKLKIVAPTILLAALLFFVLTRHWNKKKMIKQQIETKRILDEKQKQLEDEKEARLQDNMEIQHYLQQKEEQVRSLENALTHQCTRADLRRIAFLQEAICTKINDSVRGQHITVRNGYKKNVAFTNEDVAALKVAVLKHYPCFESLLLGKCPNLSYNDLQLCQLYLLGLDERQIAVLLCKTYSTIKKRAKVLEGLLGINGSLSAYIQNL